MKEIKRFENSERLVKLTHNESDNTYCVAIFVEGGKSKSEIYKSLFWAERRFVEYKNNPLESLKIK